MKKKLYYKPLSVNDAWKGQRFKTDTYKGFEKLLLCHKDTRVNIPEGNLMIKLTFGFNNTQSDWDNPIKPFVDILQRRNKFNDNRIYTGIVKKVVVPKGEEFIEYEILPNYDIDWINQEKLEPTTKDLPFLTYGQKLKAAPEILFDVYEFWEDVDWFQEISEEERLSWKYWKRINPPKENG